MATVFAKYDADKDGVLNEAEVAALLEDVGDDYVEDARAMLGRFDADGDGAIGLDEFPALWAHCRGGDPAFDPARPFGGHADADGAFPLRHMRPPHCGRRASPDGG
jgi:hypothetical protein